MAAIVAGPATYEPLAWLCPLIGVSRDAINDGSTEEYAAIAATADHHNALSATLSEAPERFAPIFARDAEGAVDIGPWCRGFYAAIKLNAKFWRKLLPARGLAHLWLIPILAHCVDADGRPVRGAPPLGPLTELARFNVDREVPGAVAAIRKFWAPTRYNRGSSSWQPPAKSRIARAKWSPCQARNGYTARFTTRFLPTE